MKNLKNIIDEINSEARQNIINAIWDRVAQINSALDDAYGSALGCHYGSALNCAAEAVDSYMELIALCKETAEQPLREHLRDALGSVKWEKFELPADMMVAIQKDRNEAANCHMSLTTKDPIKVGLFCSKITKVLKGDSDELKGFADKINPFENLIVIDNNELERALDQTKSNLDGQGMHL